MRRLYGMEVNKYHNKEWLLKQCDNNRPIKDIANECGVASQTIWHWINIHNITVNKLYYHKGQRKGCRSRSKLGIDDELLRTEYITNRRSTNDIAREYNTSHELILYHLKRANIPVRSMSEAYVKIPKTPELLLKLSISMRLSNHPNWKGGKSYEPYCINFTRQLKEEIRTIFNRKCYLCGKNEEDLRDKLSIHHCDYNKSQGCAGLRWSLIPLCRSCHTKTNFNRWYWFALLRDYWIYNHTEFNLNVNI